MPDEIKSRHVYRRLSEDERRHFRDLRQTIDHEEKENLIALGRGVVAHLEHLRDVFRQLQAERQRQGVSLAELAERSGIDKANLSRLEHMHYPNVTLATIERYAEALGKEVRITIIDPQAA